MKKVYWIQMYALTLALCRFLQVNRGKVPPDLSSTANTLYTAVDSACQILEAYDKVHARGRGTV